MKTFNQTLCLLILIPYYGNAQIEKSKLDRIIAKYDSIGGFNGCVIIATDTNHIESYSYSFKDVNSKSNEISIHDRFYLASLAKHFTGLAILQLIEKGLIGPDDAIRLYFPELQPALQKVTVRQLATHTCGIHDFHTLSDDLKDLDNTEILKLLSGLDSTVYEPGTQWGYTNSGYVLLALLIERITKTPFPTNCKEHVLDPLGITSAAFVPTKEKVLNGYNSNLVHQPILYSYSGPSGLYASGSDIINYYKAFIRSTKRWQPYIQMAEKWADQWKDAPNWTYGFGWFFSKDELGTFRAHSGKGSGFYNYIRWYDDTNLMICTLSNKEVDFVKALRDEVVEVVIKDLTKN